MLKTFIIFTQCIVSYHSKQSILKKKKFKTRMGLFDCCIFCCWEYDDYGKLVIAEFFSQDIWKPY